MRKFQHGVLLVLFFSAVSVAEQSTIAVNTFRHAAEISDIRTSSASPFRLKASLLNESGQEIAQYTLTWQSSDHWREEIRSNNEISLRIGDGPLVWFNDDRPAIGPIQRSFRDLSIPVHLQIRPDDKLSNPKKKKWNDVEAQCVDRSGQMLGEERYCFDFQTGVFLGTEWNTLRTEYSDFRPVKDKLVPFRVRELTDGKLRSEIQVEELSAISDPQVFTPGANFKSRPGCEFPNMFQVTYAPDPEYPSRLRTSRVQQVQVEAVVNETGTVTDMKIIKSAGELDQYALQALQQWRFRPATCGTTPVPYELHTEINFRSR